LVVAVLLVVGGITAYYMTAAGPQAPTVKRVKETLIIGTTDSVQTTLDPAESYDYLGVKIIQNLWEGLFSYEPSTTIIVNRLAESYTISSDRKVWEIKIRTDAKFQDGSPLTAQEVVWSWERTIKLNQDPAFLIADLIEKAEAVDRNTVRVHLKEPFEETYVKALLSTWVAFPVNPKTSPMEVVKPPKTLDMIGPYKLQEWRPGEHIVLVANPNYYGEKPKTPTVIIRFYKDPQSLRLAVERGEIDVAFRTLSPADLKGNGQKPSHIKDHRARHLGCRRPPHSRRHRGILHDCCGAPGSDREEGKGDAHHRNDRLSPDDARSRWSVRLPRSQHNTELGRRALRLWAVYHEDRQQAGGKLHDQLG
jgi:peptide/nickel transport system substrate-binding protein